MQHVANPCEIHFSLLNLKRRFIGLYIFKNSILLDRAKVYMYYHKPERECQIQKILDSVYPA